MDENRKKALELALLGIEKQYGKGAVMRLEGESKTERPDVAVISTGSVSLDIAVGIGGYPRGRIVEIYGPESSGKTTLTLHGIAEAQKAGGVCAFIDAEHALDVNYARRLGVKVDELLVSQPDNGEQALEIADLLVRSGAIDVVAIDSVAAVLAITTNTFVVWASIALAVLGLRALYFCLAGLLKRFVHLHYGLAFLLAFAGAKLILSETPVGKLPVWLSLSVIALTLTVSIVWSLLDTRGADPEEREEVSPPAAAR